MTDGAPPAHPYLASIVAATIGVDATDPDQRPLVLARRLSLGEDLGLVARELGTTPGWARWDIDNETPWTVADILLALKSPIVQAGPTQVRPGATSDDSVADGDEFDSSLPTVPDQSDDAHGKIRVVEAGSPRHRNEIREYESIQRDRALHRLEDQAQWVAEWSEANPSVPPEEGAKALGCDIETFRKLLGRHLSRHEDYAPVPAQLFEGTEIMLQGPPLEPLIEKIMEQSKDSSHRPLVMARAYAFGRTLDEIGRAYGVTRERVRQILNRMTPWSAGEIVEARNRQSEIREAWHRDRVAEWSDRNLGASLGDGADDLGYDEDEFRRLLGTRRRFHTTLVDAGVSTARRGDDEILDDLRKFHAETGKSTTAAFSRWAREAGVAGPQTVMYRFGSWNQAATRAGIKDAAPVGRERRYTEEDLWAAAIEGIAAGFDTTQRIESWLASREGMPSLALIRSRLQVSWYEIRTVALTILSRRSERDPEWVASVTSERDWPSFLDDEDAMVHMRDARLALGQNITTAKFAEWARSMDRPGPITIQRRTGKTWAELVAAVGGVPNPPRRSFYTDEDLLAWLRAYLESDPDGSYAGYEAWRQDFEGPGASTVSRVFGGWEKARDRARRDRQAGG